SSFTAIIKALTAVLKEKRSVSSSTFLMVRCNTFNSSAAGCSSVQTSPFCSSKNNRHNFFKKRCTPSIPLVSQGLLCSTGPRNISYMRKVSAPYFKTSSSGLTVLNLDLDIFSTSTPQMYLPSSKINSALAYSPLRHFLNASVSNSMPSTIFTSTWIGEKSSSLNP